MMAMPEVAEHDADLASKIARAWNGIPQSTVLEIIRLSLGEDIGNGDITTALIVPPEALAEGHLIARRPGVVAGLQVAQLTFQALDSSIDWTSLVADGDLVAPGAVLALCSGHATSMLTAERVALNLLQRMSGVATLTRSFVDLVANTKARILDTRKTAPGLRPLDKYAVVCGGGYNHRCGLSDGILIKDNHIRVAGSVERAVSLARQGGPHGLRIEVEVEDAGQIEDALSAGADAILLDNMDPFRLTEAVKHIGGRALTEASGGVSLKTVRAISETGVDLISVGQLTHSATALDISLEFGL